MTFPDAEEALAVAQQAEVAVAGQTVAVCMGGLLLLLLLFRMMHDDEWPFHLFIKMNDLSQ